MLNIVGLKSYIGLVNRAIENNRSVFQQILAEQKYNKNIFNYGVRTSQPTMFGGWTQQYREDYRITETFRFRRYKKFKGGITLWW